MRGFDDWALSPSNRTQGAALQHRHARTCRPRVIVDSAVEHPVTRLIHDEASQQRQRCSSGVHRCFTRVASKTAGCSRRKHRAASRRRVKHVEFRVGGCRAPGPHAISTRTAHTTTTSSIHRVPKTVGRIPGSTLPSAIATGWGVYQSTSLRHCKTAAATSFMSLPLTRRANVMQPFSLPDARCLDGSPAGGHIRRDNTSSTVLMYLEGGGFCDDARTCAGRAYGDGDGDGGAHWQGHGGSAAWKPSCRCALLLTEDCEPQHRALCDATHVYLRYCSGDRWTGTLGSSRWFDGDNRSYTFGGTLILAAALRKLRSEGLLRRGGTLLFGGQSAGGRRGGGAGSRRRRPRGGQGGGAQGATVLAVGHRRRAARRALPAVRYRTQRRGCR